MIWYLMIFKLRLLFEYMNWKMRIEIFGIIRWRMRINIFWINEWKIMIIKYIEWKEKMENIYENERIYN